MYCHSMYVVACRYGNYADMFLKLLKDSEDETWDTFFVFEKDSPPNEVLAQYEASAACDLDALHFCVLCGNSAQSCSIV